MAVAIYKDKRSAWSRQMITDFQNDICIFVSVVLEDKMPPPFQRLRLREMAEKRFFLDLSGVNVGKTRNAAHYVAWRASCFGNADDIDAGQEIAILSHTFRGAKLVFDYVEGWYYTRPEFRKQFKKKPIHAPDIWTAEFKNNSSIRVLPSNIVRLSEGLAGERWNVVIVDEITKFPPNIISSKIDTRVNRPHEKLSLLLGNSVPEKILQNHTIYLGNACWTFSPIYREILGNIVEKAKDKDSDYGFQSWNYTAIPKDWEKALGVDEKLTKKHHSEMSQAVFDMLVMGICQNSSEGYYPAELVIPLQTNDVKVELIGDEDGIYILGTDPAGTENKSDFSMCVWKIVGEMAHLVYGYRQRRVEISGNPNAMLELIYDVVQKFRIKLIVMDWGGGGGQLAGHLFQVPKELNMYPIVKMEDVRDGQHILCMFQIPSRGIKKLFGESIGGDDILINRSHTLFQSAIENKKIAFAGSVGEGRKEQEIIENIVNVINEIIAIDRKKDTDGNFSLTSKGQFKFFSKGRKDSAMSALYGFIGTLIYRKLYMEATEEEESNYYTRFGESDEETD